MRKIVFLILFIILIVSAGLFLSGRERFLYNGDNIFPLSINMKRLPFEIVPRVVKYGNENEDKIFFLIKNEIDPHTKDPGVFSYFFNKKKELFLYTYLDSSFNKHYMKACFDKNGFTTFQEISKQNMLLSKKQEVRIIQNFFSHDNDYALLQTFLVFFFLIGAIYITLVANIKGRSVSFKTKKYFTFSIMFVILIGVLLVFHFDVKASKYGSSSFLNFERKRYDVHISSSEIVLRSSIDSIGFLLSIKDKNDMEIISEGDTIYWNKPVKIKKFISYFRDKNALLLSFTSDDNESSYTEIVKTPKGTCDIRKISNSDWIERKNDKYFYVLRNNYKKFSSYRNIVEMLTFIFIGILILSLMQYFYLRSLSNTFKKKKNSVARGGIEPPTS